MSDIGIPVGYTCETRWVRTLVWFIAETARPMSIWLTALSLAYRFALSQGADVGELTVMAGTLTLLYGAKVTEKALISRSDANVQVAQAKQPQPQGATP